jgi:RNA polymerase sigma factor (sigma-70 family)
MELSEVYEQNIELIYRYFRLRTFSKEVAEDLTSDTFLRFVDKRELFENSELASAKAYLYGIAKNVLLEYLKQKYQQEISLGDNLDFYEHVSVYVETYSKADVRDAILKGLIAQLPGKQREIATLRLLEKKSSQEVMKITGKDSNYVRTTQKRAVASLKKLWECTQTDTNLIELTQNHA